MQSEKAFLKMWWLGLQNGQWLTDFEKLMVYEWDRLGDQGSTEGLGCTCFQIWL